MRHAGFVFGAFLLFTASAGAQVNSVNSPLFASLDSGAATAASTPVAPFTFVPALPAIAASGVDAAPANSAEASESAAQEPTVQGVFQNYNWQAYAGYTFVRLYLAPTMTRNTNGLDLSVVYYPKGGHIAADGEFIGAWGTSHSKLLVGMGGGRYRWSIPMGMEVWGHGLVGGTHFLPQTAYGSQSAFAYEVGGGLDIPIRNHGRYAFRLGADMVGTHYFGTYQFSPKFTTGIVFRY
jgi:hypothetical protein